MKNCFVYVYKDPDNLKPFYVGKGSGKRHLAHLKPSLWKFPDNTSNPFLYWKLNSLLKNDKFPIIEKIVENISNVEAYKIEKEYIEKYGRKFVDDTGLLMNISDFMGGPHTGYKVKWSDERITNYRKYHIENRTQILKKDLIEMYLNKNMKRKEIAKFYNVSDVLIKVRLKEYDIKKPKALKQKVIKSKYKKRKSTKNKAFRENVKCLKCKKEEIFIGVFTFKGNNTKHFCSYKCATEFRKNKTLNEYNYLLRENKLQRKKIYEELSKDEKRSC